MILNQHPRHRSPGRTFLRRLWSQGYLDAIDDETAMMMSGRNSSQSLALAIISSGLLECMADDHSLFQRMLKAIERLTGKIASPAGVVGNMIVRDRSDVASVSGSAEYPPLLPRGPDVPAFITLSSHRSENIDIVGSSGNKIAPKCHRHSRSNLAELYNIQPSRGR